METPTNAVQTRKRGPGRPFTKENPRPGPGRPASTPEQRAAKAAAAVVTQRAINDLTAEMKQHAALAVDNIIQTIRTAESAELRLRASDMLLSRAFGTPVNSTVLHASMTADQGEARRPNIEQLQAAARRLLLGTVVEVDAVEVERE
jgi:hypothetical protein